MHSFRSSSPIHLPFYPALLHRQPMEPTSPSAILKSQLAGSSLQSCDQGGSAGIQCVYTSCLGVHSPRQNPRLGQGPRDSWQQQEATQTPQMSRSATACAKARFPPSSLTASTALSLVHPGLCSQDSTTSPAQMKPTHLSPTDSTWGRPSLGNALLKEGRDLPRLNELPHPGS